MNPDLLAFGFLQYVVFLFSTTCHEASHALVAKHGGDTTALEGGQVSLSPIPHIRREPFGMVIVPILGIATGSGLIGWASAPYNPQWAANYPKRAALMSAAGPAANFALAFIAAIIMRIGLAVGTFVPSPTFFSHMVGAAEPGGVMEGVTTALSVLFSLNVLLGVFNLIPIPPLDGYGILGLFTSERGALRLQEWRMQMRSVTIIGLVVAWQLFDRIFPPFFNAAGKVLYFGYRFS
jgi:Zn-dependent protease